MVPEDMAQLQWEIDKKVQQGQARLVDWEDIKNNIPKQLKVSPIVMIPHKSRVFWAILDLSFALRLANGDTVPSVNQTSVKTAPRGVINQMGQALTRLIHAFFAAAGGDEKVSKAKWDIKDGFWRLDCEEGEE